MSVTARLRTYLDENGVGYQVVAHPATYSASKTAQAAHTPGKMVAKVVIVKNEAEYAMVVLPSTAQVDIVRLREELGPRWSGLRLATEGEFADLFPDCELGMMPPFGNLYGLPVWVDVSLTEDEEVLFPAGNAREAIRMRYDDFERIVLPRVLHAATRRMGSAAA